MNRCQTGSGRTDARKELPRGAAVQNVTGRKTKLGAIARKEPRQLSPKQRNPSLAKRFIAMRQSKVIKLRRVLAIFRNLAKKAPIFFSRSFTRRARGSTAVQSVFAPKAGLSSMELAGPATQAGGGGRRVPPAAQRREDQLFEYRPAWIGLPLVQCSGRNSWGAQQLRWPWSYAYELGSYV